MRRMKIRATPNFGGGGSSIRGGPAKSKPVNTGGQGPSSDLIQHVESPKTKEKSPKNSSTIDVPEILLDDDAEAKDKGTACGSVELSSENPDSVENPAKRSCGVGGVDPVFAKSILLDRKAEETENCSENGSDVQVLHSNNDIQEIPVLRTACPLQVQRSLEKASLGSTCMKSSILVVDDNSIPICVEKTSENKPEEKVELTIVSKNTAARPHIRRPKIRAKPSLVGTMSKKTHDGTPMPTSSVLGKELTLVQNVEIPAVSSQEKNLSKPETVSIKRNEETPAVSRQEKDLPMPESASSRRNEEILAVSRQEKDLLMPESASSRRNEETLAVSRQEKDLPMPESASSRRNEETLAVSRQEKDLPMPESASSRRNEETPAGSSQDKNLPMPVSASSRRPKIRAKPSLLGSVGRKNQVEMKQKSSVPATPMVEMKQKSIVLDTPMVEMKQKSIVPVAPMVEMKQKSIVPVAPMVEMKQKSSMPVTPLVEMKLKSSVPVTPMVEMKQKSSVLNTPMVQMKQKSSVPVIPMTIIETEDVVLDREVTPIPSVSSTDNCSTTVLGRRERNSSERTGRNSLGNEKKHSNVVVLKETSLSVKEKQTPRTVKSNILTPLTCAEKFSSGLVGETLPKISREVTHSTTTRVTEIVLDNEEASTATSSVDVIPSTSSVDVIPSTSSVDVIPSTPSFDVIPSTSSVHVSLSTSSADVIPEKPKRKQFGFAMRRPKIHAKPTFLSALGRKADQQPKSELQVQPKDVKIETIYLDDNKKSSRLKEEEEEEEEVFPKVVSPLHRNQSKDLVSEIIAGKRTVTEEVISDKSPLSHVTHQKKPHTLPSKAKQTETIIEKRKSRLEGKLFQPSPSASNLKPENFEAQEVFVEDFDRRLVGDKEPVKMSGPENAMSCKRLVGEKEPVKASGLENAKSCKKLVREKESLNVSGPQSATSCEKLLREKEIVNVSGPENAMSCKNIKREKESLIVSGPESATSSSSSIQLGNNIRRSRIRAKPSLFAKRKATAAAVLSPKEDVIDITSKHQEEAIALAEKVAAERDGKDQREHASKLQEEVLAFSEKVATEGDCKDQTSSGVVEQIHQTNVWGVQSSKQSLSSVCDMVSNDEEQNSCDVKVDATKIGRSGVLGADGRQVSRRCKTKKEACESVHSDDSGGDKENSSKQLIVGKTMRRERVSKYKPRLSKSVKAKGKLIQSDKQNKKRTIKLQDKLKLDYDEEEEEEEEDGQESKRIFRERKEKYRKKFNQSQGNIERGQMTMFDLIFWNPLTNPMPGRADTPKKKDDVLSGDKADDVSSDIAEEQKIDDMGLEDKSEVGESHPGTPSGEAAVEEVQICEEVSPSEKDSKDEVMDEKEEKDNKNVDTGIDIFAPQVKIGPNGQIILDEQSIKIQTTAAKNRDEILSKAEVVEESNDSAHYGKWSKKRRRSCEWTMKETARFYKALSTVGTDFSLMETLFTWRSRAELKTKFKKEERTNRELIDRALKDCTQFDFTPFDDESDYDPEEDRKASRLAERAEAKRKRLEMKQSQREEEKLRKKLLAQEEKAKVKERKMLLRKMNTKWKPKKKAKNVQEEGGETGEEDMVALDLSDSDVEFETKALPTPTVEGNVSRRPRRKRKVQEQKKEAKKKGKTPPSPLEISEVTVTIETVKHDTEVLNCSDEPPSAEMTIEEDPLDTNVPTEKSIDLPPPDVASTSILPPDFDVGLIFEEASGERAVNPVIGSSSQDYFGSSEVNVTPSEVAENRGSNEEEKMWHLPVSAIQEKEDGAKTVSIQTENGEKLLPVPQLPPGTSDLVVVATRDLGSSTREYVYHVYTVCPVAS